MVHLLMDVVYSLIGLFFFFIRDQLLNNIFFAKMLIPSSAALAVGSSNKEPGVPSLPQVLSSTQVTYASAECGLKNIATTTKQTVILFGGNVQDSESGRQHLRSSEKTAPRRQEGKSRYIQVCNKGSSQSEHQRSGYQVKEFSILCMGRCRPLGPLSSFLSYALQLSGLILFPCSPCFLHSPSSSAITVGVGCILWISFWSHHSYLEAKNC